MDKSALDRAIEKAGNQRALADLISTKDRKITQQHISWWVKKSKGRVPDYAVLLIESATGLSRHELRPDIFGQSPAKPRHRSAVKRAA